MARRRKWSVPEYVYPDRDRHGNVRLYFIHSSLKRKFRLRAVYGTAEFEEEYRAALTQAVSAKKEVKAEKDLDWLCNRYFNSAEFKAFEQNTRRRKRSELEAICQINSISGKKIQRLGSLPFDRMPKETVVKLRDMKADEGLPGAANYRVKQVRALFSWAMSADIAKLNPATGVKKIKYASSGFYTWTEDDLAKFEAKYPIGTRERLAMAIMLYFGVRRSDACKLGPQHESQDRKSITFVMFKNRKRKPTTLTLPILPPLRQIIGASEIGEKAYVLNAHGKPFASEAVFGNWMREVCDRAGLEECTSHGLRKVASVRCAEAGATTHQMMALFGWHDINMALEYTRAAEQKKMAEQASRKIIAAPSNFPPNFPRAKRTIKLRRLTARWRSLGEFEPLFQD